MFGLFGKNSGKQFSNEIADHLGVDQSLYSTALLELGVSWGTLKALRKQGMTVEEAANGMLGTFLQGLDILENKFGQQLMIDEARERVAPLIDEQAE